MINYAYRNHGAGGHRGLTPLECVRTCTCLSVQSSSVAERTKDMCTPRPLWMPEQLMHRNVPRVADAQRGAVGTQRYVLQGRAQGCMEGAQG